jgi:AbrB family looped-hinge helix DNA binding protein
MIFLKLSSKYQVVIPKKLREEMNLQKGMQLQLVNLNGQIRLVTIRKMADLIGSMPEIDTEFVRDADREI